MLQKLKTSMSKSVTCLEERMCGLDNLPMKYQSQGTLTSSLEDLDNGEIKCTHCQKEFKTKNNLQNHVKKFHSLKCEFLNCKTIFIDTAQLETHKEANHVKCEECGKLFMTKIRLNDHFIADHRDKMIPMRTKQSIEREPSLKNHKIKRT